MTSTLGILGTTIRQDAEGRFCLNDCHKASGGENKNRPSIWADNSQTKALIAEIQAEAEIPALASIKGGNASGTYAVKELVYAYAMWISPAFHLLVIRAFDTLVSRGLHNANPLTREQQVAQALLLSQDIIREKDEQIAILAPKAEVADKIAESGGLYTLNLSAKAANMPLQQFVRAAHANGFIFKQHGKWNAYAEKVKAGFCHVKFHPYRDRDGDERFSPQVFFTPKGITRLVQITGQH